jgi:alpha-tubulin suppressor-like RCC1 family protein
MVRSELFLSRVVALFLFVFAPGTVAAADPWSMQGHDAQRTGRSTVPGPATPALKWTYDFPFRVQDNASPIVGPDGTIHENGTAINPDGTFKRWTLGGGRHAPALSPDGKILYTVREEGIGSYVTAVDSQADRATAVAAGGNQSLALKQNGTVWTWGWGGTVHQVQGLGVITAIAAGELHSLTLKQDGTVRAWGNNLDGQLGNGTNIDSDVPVPVSNLSTAIAIAAGGDHSLALKQDGTVWAWGDNSAGQLGNGTNTDSNIPVPVSNLSNVTRIAAGQFHSMALKQDGTVWAWGYNYFGTLGNDTNTDSNIPVPVSNLSNVTAIAAGGSHSLALKQDGTVRAWGSNGSGTLGDGTDRHFSYIPVPVSNLSNVTAIAAGGSHSLALKQDRTAWAWGNNLYGQLGNGTDIDYSNVPVPVSNLSNVTAIAAGSIHSLALKQDSNVWTWGYDLDHDSNVPIRIRFLDGFWQYPIGRLTYSSFAVGGDGTIYVGTWEPAMYAIKPDGTLKWRYHSPSVCAIEAPPAIDANGNVYFAHNCEGLVALDANGRLRWTDDRVGTGYGWPTPTIGPDGTIYIERYAFNPNGTLKWQREDLSQPGYFHGVAISTDGSTIYLAAGGKVYALAASTGATRWASTIADSSERFGGSPALSSNGILYVMGDRGLADVDYVYGVSASDGTLLWQYQLNSHAFYWGPQSPALGPDGTLYVVSSGAPSISAARLYAFRPSCLYSGSVVRVTVTPGNSPSTIYVRPSALSSVFFSGTTSDAKLIRTALRALKKQTKVAVAGPAGTCPAATVGGNIGTINALIVNP